MNSLADMKISRTGFGAWAIGGGGWRFTWGATDDAESVAAIRRAVALGVNWIDTAAVYGLGHSETVVGRALASLPPDERPYVFTKAGLVWNEAQPLSAPYRIMRPESVRREVDASLRRLGVDHIDLYQVHWPDTGESLDWDTLGGDGTASPNATPLAEYWQVMADLRQAGKVRAIGLSNHGVAQLAEAEAIAHVDAIQPPFSALDRSAAPEVAWAREHGTAVIAYSPMASGLLTGAFSAERVAALPADDWRRAHPDFTDRLPENLAVADVLGTIAEQRGVPVPAVAVAWTLAWPGVTGAIVGARTPAQVADWAGAGHLHLGEEELAAIARVLGRTGAGTGPFRP
ncbi:aldo/keto reductase [Streptomyces sp. NBC_01803]|uniref:aldo/keto reductase n=1 Tax=Streptomyces sp. NBC_01803 TaxID=2975946 RepID=UPI002DD94006|nr:aldo/keto reductase [Streptomyces sp. NBC_01803]WSA43449.1 aldo/keto reductase [Streptomyces sp. NBC_01803]